MLSIGAVIDNRYKILRVIGRGGTSSVYLAENIRLHNYWAIKELYKNSISGNGSKPGTLIAETSILTRLRHPGLPSIIDIIETADTYLIVMEYIEGTSLDKVLAKQGAQPEQNVIQWGRQLCQVLAYLHSRTPAIIHRDVKPANIILKPDGNVVLIDFGIAREFKNKSVRDTDNLGTRGYAAPEQYNSNQQSDARTDIYCLGVTLYHLVTGKDPCQPPYGLQSIRTVNPSLSADLERIIEKCVQYQPNDRYQTAERLGGDLQRIGSEETLPGLTQALDKEEPQKSNSGVMMALLCLIPVFVLILLACVLVPLGGGQNQGNAFVDIGSFIPWRSGGDESHYEEYYVNVFEADKRINIEFDVPTSGAYYIYSVSSDQQLPLAWVCDQKDNIIAQNNTSGEYLDFEIYCWLNAGEEYYIETTLYDWNPDYEATGEYWVCIQYDEGWKE